MPDTQAKVPSKITKFRQEFEKWKPRLEVLAPKHVGVDRLMNLAQSAVTRDDRLRSSLDHPKTQGSILKACIGAIQLGLEVDTMLGECTIQAFKDHKSGAYIAQLMIGYPGFAKLSYQSGMIDSIETRAVFEGDDFDYEYGTNGYIKHKPVPAHDQGQLTHAYAIIWPKNSNRPVFRVLSRTEIDAVKAAAPSSKSKYSPWNVEAYFPEMAMKTAFKRTQKYAPKSPELSRAVRYDNLAEAHEPQFTEIDLGEIEEAEIETNGSRTRKLKDKLTNGEKPKGSAAAPADNQGPPEDSQAPPDEPSPEPAEAGPQEGSSGEAEKKRLESEEFRQAMKKLDPVCRNKLCPNKGTAFGATVDPHHLIKRSQGGEYSVGNGLGLCRDCHNLVENGGEFNGKELTGKQIELEILEGWLYTDDWRWDQVYEELRKKEKE